MSLSYYKSRSSLKRVIHEFFSEYLEIDSPILVSMPGVEAHMRYMAASWVDYKQRKRSAWLRSSPEIHMKQLCASGLTKIYQLGPCFRAAENSDWHHKEFYMLEWYTASMSYKELMRQTEEFLKYCFSSLSQVSLPQNFSRLSVFECFEEFLGTTLLDQDEDLPRKLKEAGVISVTCEDDFESAFYKAMLEIIEPKLASMQAVLLYDYPPSQGVLSEVAKAHGSEDVRAQRVEAYIQGIEITNGCMELQGSTHNRERIDVARQMREKLGFEIPEVDETFLSSCDALPASLCGSACGFDRLLALIFGDVSIHVRNPFSHS